MASHRGDGSLPNAARTLDRIVASAHPIRPSRRPPASVGRFGACCLLLAATVASVVAATAAASALAATTGRPATTGLASTSGKTGGAKGAARAAGARRASALAAAVTARYRSEVAAAAGKLVDDVDSIDAALRGGDDAAARTAELAAQADFDELRVVDAASPQNAAAIDALPGQQLRGATFGGLHAVEKALWSEGDPAAPLPSLEAQAAVALDVLSRQRLSPAVIATVAVRELDWLVDQALPGREELFSHLDGVDVAASAASASAAFDAVRPLACALGGPRCAKAALELSALAASVSALGPPDQVATATLAAAERSLSEEADRAAETVASLVPRLARFGTSGPEPYGAAAPHP